MLFDHEGIYYVYGITEHFGTPVKVDMTMELNQIHIENVTDCLEIIYKVEELFDIGID